ncbi:MAG TPA: phosphoenolpyruvate--protein phosphotransferase [Candidatus Binatia bacterium]|nr:phosphoenolpyruvate--protein phosphotransferase [Candidatus Binatia bacterium]
MQQAVSEMTRARRGAGRHSGRARGLLLLEDVGRLIGEAADLPSTLARIVGLVAGHLDMEVCSLYRLGEGDRLVLVATKGLDPGSVGSVSMSIDEGLTGFAIQKREPVMAIDALAHPRYKYFPETGEERYHSFLGVPIFDKGQPLGVLVVQTSRRRRFTRDEVRLLKAVAVPLGGVLVQMALLESLESKEEERRGYQERMLDAIKRLQSYERQQRPGRKGSGVTAVRLTGWPAAPGFGIGRAHLLASPLNVADARRRRGRHSAKGETSRFAKAVARAAEEIERLKERVQTSFPEIDASVFDAQKLMITDPSFASRVRAAIAQGMFAEAALESVVAAMVEEFGKIEDDYLKERVLDIKDIGQRVLRSLLGVAERDRSFASAVVLVAPEFSLSDIILIEQEQLKGLVMASGGVTSHASILAKSLEIPTVVGAERLEEIHEGDHLIVDGNAGTVYVNPSPEVLREYERLKNEYSAFNRELDALRTLEAVTRDGCRVELAANIGLLGDIAVAQRHGAAAVGLYRTEIAFLSHRDFLSEEEQVTLYERIVRAAEGMPITIRTLDLGADKYPSYLHVPFEANPFLGWRSIRISLAMPNVFKVQLRAIMRASILGRVRIMFPMISSLEEIRRCKALVEEAREELRREGHPVSPSLPIGIMVEVPSAVLIAEQLIQEVDFFSIGTNDLIQYLLAVDRGNRKVASLYEPLHPAVLRTVASIVRSATSAGKPVSLCGEMAADPVCTLILVGIGLRQLSMSAFFVPLIKRLIRAIDLSTAERVASEVLRMGTVKEVKSHVFEQMRALDVVDLMETYH